MLDPNNLPRSNATRRARFFHSLSVTRTGVLVVCALLLAAACAPLSGATPPLLEPLSTAEPIALPPEPRASLSPQVSASGDAAMRLALTFQTPVPAPVAAVKENPSDVAPGKNRARGYACPQQIEWDRALPWNDIWFGDASRPQVAITFDTGQGTPVVLNILDTLAARGVHATFFVMGSWADKNIPVVQRMVADGHHLGNHSFSHPDFVNLSDAQMDWELEATERSVQAATGCTTHPYLRLPFGSTNDHIRARHVALGWRDILWTVDSGDWRGFSVETIQAIILGKARNGAVLIFHSSVPETAQALPGVIDGLRARGFTLVTLTDLLQTPPRIQLGPKSAVRMGE